MEVIDCLGYQLQLDEDTESIQGFILDMGMLHLVRFRCPHMVLGREEDCAQVQTYQTERWRTGIEAQFPTLIIRTSPTGEKYTEVYFQRGGRRGFLNVSSCNADDSLICQVNEETTGSVSRFTVDLVQSDAMGRLYKHQYELSI